MTVIYADVWFCGVDIHAANKTGRLCSKWESPACAWIFLRVCSFCLCIVIRVLKVIRWWNAEERKTCCCHYHLSYISCHYPLSRKYEIALKYACKPVFSCSIRFLKEIQHDSLHFIWQIVYISVQYLTLNENVAMCSWWGVLHLCKFKVFQKSFWPVHLCKTPAAFLMSFTAATN